ncbi:unnamed protein product [Rotaria magnacalcarata]|uniref:Uncharacterized protein n=1 Tax=Rotaria magnacalcarata TaxID=392030 RepID=A0A816YX58_9BILA|nr:unnamed protein product [Rotaria magnacalcarata]CAF4352663.1 unnamed protein product [Rotaria magnacalcarata]
MLSLTSDLSALLKKKSKSEHTSTTLIDVNADECYKKDQKAKIISKVNIEYLNILLPHLKHYNAYCALCMCTRYFGKNISQSTTLLLRCTLKCSGHVCNFNRPIRGSQRRAIMDKFKAGGSVYHVHAQYDEKRTIHGKKVLILMQLASRKKVFKKIKVEANAEYSLLPDTT